MASSTCLVPDLLDPAAALGRHPHARMKLPSLGRVATCLLGVPRAVYMRPPLCCCYTCTRIRTRQPPSASAWASLHVPAPPTSLQLGLTADGLCFAPLRFPASNPVLHLSRGRAYPDNLFHRRPYVMARPCRGAVAGECICTSSPARPRLYNRLILCTHQG